MELADGQRTNGLALKRGDATVNLMDSEGQHDSAILRRALYILAFPQDLCSVLAATTNGAEVHFKGVHNQLIHKNGIRFDIKECARLYYLNTVTDETDNEGCYYDIQTWFEILGDSNYDVC